MKTNFTYSFKHNSCTTDENGIDVKAVLDSVHMDRDWETNKKIILR